MRCSSLALTLFVGATASAQTHEGSVTRANGVDLNPLCLASRAAPRVGSTWIVDVDTGAFEGVQWTLVEARAEASAGSFVRAGELLVDLESPLLFRSLGKPVDGRTVHAIEVPADPGLAGLELSVQALLGPPVLRLSNGENVVVGQPEPPRARFSAYPTLGLSSHAVRFHGIPSGLVADYLWDFGDGGTSSARNPRHVYAGPGVYDVALTVSSLAGSHTLTREAFVSVFDPDTSPQAGYTLEISSLPTTNASANPFLSVLDMDLSTVHTIQDPLPGWAIAEIAKPLSHGGLLALIYERASGPTKKRAVELDSEGSVLWQFDPGAERLSADVERLPNGNTLLLSWLLGTWPAVNPKPIFDERIREVDASGKVVWTWSMADNYEAMPFSALERAYLAARAAQGAGIWLFHTNSVGTLPANQWEATDARFRQGNVIVSLRDTSKVFIIDRHTNEVVWSYGDLVAQHHARMIPLGLPGAGNILVFDNGGTGGLPPTTRAYSRLLEIDPSTSRVVWSYSPPGFYSLRMGSVQRLANGNTFFCEGTNGVIKEVDPGGNLLWQHVRTGSRIGIFRAYRVPYSWPSGPIEFAW